MKKVLAVTIVLVIISVLGVTGYAAFQMQPVDNSAKPPNMSTLAISNDSENAAIEAKVGAFSYPDIVVEVGKPVSINFKVDAADLNACNNEIIIPEFGIQQKLVAGDNIVTFTPSKSGSFTYTCWMGMISGTIKVVEAGDGEVGATPGTESSYGGCPMIGGSAGNGNFGSYGSGGYGMGGCCG